MNRLSRRRFLGTVAAAGALRFAAAKTGVPLRIGVTDWNINLTANPDAIPTAARLGFQGVQVSFGRKLVDGKMPADQPETIAQYLKLSRQHKLPIDGTCVDRLHDNGLISDPLASKWVLDAIRLTKELHTKVLLVPFFGRWSIKTSAHMQHVGDALRELAPEAEKVGVILGLENTISAEDNVRIMERSRAKNVLVYYDVGNSTENGFDVVREIRWLGKDRICQFHFKDNPHYLGEGSIQFAPIVQAIKDIEWSGWANLETDVPAPELEAGMRRNLIYIRGIVGQIYG